MAEQDVLVSVLNLVVQVKFLKLSLRENRVGYIDNRIGDITRARGLGVMTLP